MRMPIVLFALLCWFTFACNRHWSYSDKERIIYDECYNEIYFPDIKNLNRYVGEFLASLPNEDLNYNFIPVEVYYFDHCFECSDDDRYKTLIRFISEEEVYFIKINTSRTFYYSAVKNVNSSFFTNINKLYGKFSRRDCLVEDGALSTFLVKNIETGKWLSYYESIGFDGTYRDATENNLDFRDVIIYLESLSQEID